MLTSKQRAILRGKANTMDPVFIVGKGEIDETMIQGVKDCLEARELIKMRSRRYAKRQLLWFKRDDRIVWFDMDEFTIDEVVTDIYRRIEAA